MSATWTMARPGRLGRLTLMVALMMSAACDDLILDGADPAEGSLVYEELWQTFDERYAPFVQRGVDWDAAFGLHHPGDGADEGEVWAAATALLAELDDGHVTLVAPGRPFFNAKRTFREDTFQGDVNLFLIFQEMTDGPHTRGAARYGTLPDNLGYVHIGNWNDPIPDLEGLMTYFLGRDGVIVDLRHNPGGDFTNGFPFAARFADQPRLAFVTETRTGPEPGDLGQRVEWTLTPEGSTRFTGPVVVLSNGFTNSAAERTLMGFRVLPNVTVVGSRSAGNHGEKVGGELSNGWRYSVVPQVVTAADGVSYEGPGLPPDLLVENTAEEIATGLDRQFEAAVGHLVGPG